VSSKQRDAITDGLGIVQDVVEPRDEPMDVGPLDLRDPGRVKLSDDRVRDGVASVLDFGDGARVLGSIRRIVEGALQQRDGFDVLRRVRDEGIVEAGVGLVEHAPPLSPRPTRRLRLARRVPGSVQLSSKLVAGSPTRPANRARASPSAIWLRAEFATHRNRTLFGVKGAVTHAAPG
jgi:hypothetical protein